MLSSFKNFITGDSILNTYQIEEQEVFTAYDESCCKVYKTRNNFSAIIYEKSLISKARQEDFLSNSKWLMKTIHPSFLKLVEKVSHSPFKTILISERMVCSLKDLIVLYTSFNSMSRSSSDVNDSFNIHLSKITNILGVNSISDIESIFNSGLYCLFEGSQFLQSTKGFFPVLSPESIFVNLCGEFKIGFITTNKPEGYETNGVDNNNGSSSNDIFTPNTNRKVNVFEEAKKNILSLLTNFPKTNYIINTISTIKSADPLTLQATLSQDSHYQTLLNDIKAFPSSTNIQEAISILSDLNKKQQKISSLLVSQSLTAFTGILESSYKLQVTEAILVLLDFHILSSNKNYKNYKNNIRNTNNINNGYKEVNEEFFKSAVLPHIKTIVKIGFNEYNEKYMSHIISIITKFGLTSLTTNNNNNIDKYKELENEIMQNLIDSLNIEQKLSWSITLNFLTSSFNTPDDKENYFLNNKPNFEKLISNVKKGAQNYKLKGLVYLDFNNVINLLKSMHTKYNNKILRKYITDLKPLNTFNDSSEIEDSTVNAFLELYNGVLETFGIEFRTLCLQNIIELVSTHKCNKEVFSKSVKSLNESVEKIKKERQEYKGVEDNFLSVKQETGGWDDMFDGLKTRKGNK